VGKTTTVAKLAANFRLRDRVRVGLVTVDTFRVAAVEQLRTYAQIIDLPMEVVSTPDEMRAAIARFASLDLVLIDTDGRSPREARHVEQLRRILEEAGPHQSHLVVSAAASSAALGEALQRFASLRPSSMMLTKLDEAPSMGHTAALLAGAGLPISYLTDGQSVPEDIRVAEPAWLAARLLAPRPLDAEAA
jgi:flagellar biosynthesis protein FlhF